MSRPAVVFDKVSKIYSLSHKKTEGIKDKLTRLISGNKERMHVQAVQEDFYALNDVSFEIQPGESVGIIGPNGSGKSTSLKVLAGVTKPSSGRFELNGRLGALIEVGAGFHPELTGRENVYMNGSILGMSKKEIDRKFDSIVDFSEIEKFIDTPVKHYSSGMYVRLGFAVAIHNEPEVMLVDEALAVGDMGFQKKCFTRMQELKREGRTFILVSHSMSQIQTMCGRALLLHKGKLIEDGSPIEVSGSYINLGETQNIQQTHSQAGEAVSISTFRTLSATGEKTSCFKLHETITFEISLNIKNNLSNPTIVLVFKKNGIRVYASSTRFLELKLGALSKHATISCVVPDLQLMPAAYDTEIVVFNEDQTERLAFFVVSQMFEILPPSDLRELGCGIPVDPAERGVVYQPAQWLVNNMPIGH